MSRPKEFCLNETRLSDHYVFGDAIGKGGFGTVYEAFSISNPELKIAIKAIPRKSVHHWEKTDSGTFPMEVVLLERLNHKNIIKMRETFEEDDMFYIVMDRPNGRHIDLFDLITQDKCLDEKKSKDILIQLIHALQHCQDNGVFHRDVKDENILVDLDSGEIKLIDFGSGTNFTHQPLVSFEGTRVYCPPEWITKRSYYAEKATVWSLGILLFDMLQGDIPFDKDCDIALAKPSFLNSCSKEAEDLILKMLSLSPEDRPTLEQILRHPFLKPPSNPQQRHKQAIPKSIALKASSLINQVSVCIPSHSSKLPLYQQAKVNLLAMHKPDKSNIVQIGTNTSMEGKCTEKCKIKHELHTCKVINQNEPNSGHAVLTRTSLVLRKDSNFTHSRANNNIELTNTRNSHDLKIKLEQVSISSRLSAIKEKQQTKRVPTGKLSTHPYIVGLAGRK